MRVSHLTASEKPFIAAAKDNNKRAEAKTDIQAVRKHTDFGLGHSRTAQERIA